MTAELYLDSELDRIENEEKEQERWLEELSLDVIENMLGLNEEDIAEALRIVFKDQLLRRR